MKKKGKSSRFLAMNRIIFVFFFSAAPLFAAVNGFDIGFSMGYRHDHDSARISDYQEGDHLHGVELDAYFHINARNVQLSGRLDGGWFVSGWTQNHPAMGVSGQPVYASTFRQSAGGFFADGNGQLGYIIRLFSNRRSSFQIVPLGGYGVFYQNLKHGVSHPETNASAFASMSCDLSHHRLLLQWQGPSVGADVLYQPVKAWSLGAGYGYFFLHFSETIDYFEHLSYLNSGAVQSEYFIRKKLHAAGGGAHGQAVYAKIAGQIAEGWMMNWRFALYNFASKKKSAVEHRQIQQVAPAPASFSDESAVDFTAGWHAISALVEVEYFF
jgi:hypothetical protein